MKLFKIEWIKLAHQRFTWIALGLYTLLIVAICASMGGFTVGGAQEGGGGFQTFADAGFYKPDVLWHDLAYVPSYFKFIPAFLLIFFVCNEYSYRTARQNVIDGLSRSQLYFSKGLTGLLLVLFSFLVFAITGAILAFKHNDNLALSELFQGSDYLLAYILEMTFLMFFALFLSILLKRAAITVIVLLLYYLIEGILASILVAYGGSISPLAEYLPTQPSRNLIVQPFTRLFTVAGASIDDMMGLGTSQRVPLKALWLTVGYSAVFLLSGNFLFKRSNL